MRILYLVGGNDIIAGGATVRDAAFVRGLVDAGHEVEALSLYGQAKVEGEHVFSGAFKPLGRHTLRRLFPSLAKVPSALTSLMHLVRPVDNMTSIAVMGRRVTSGGLTRPPSA